MPSNTPHPHLPHISVIITVLNGQEHLPSTLASVAAQEYPNFDVVVIDDGSTDQTSQIIQGFCQQDSRFHCIRTPNRGMSPSRNLAVKHSAGEWIAVCDGDDLWRPDKLTVQAQAIAAWRGKRPLAALGSRGYVINRAGQLCETLDVPLQPFTLDSQDATYDDSLNLRFINSSGVFSRALFNEVGGYRAEYTPSEDLDLWLRLLERGEVVNVPEHLTYYRLHGQNFSFRSYVSTQLAGHRAHMNAQRRRRGQPEWNGAEYVAALHQTPGQYTRIMQEYRCLTHVNAAKVNLLNGRRWAALRAIAHAALVDPAKTFKLISGKIMSGSGLLRQRRNT